MGVPGPTRVPSSFSSRDSMWWALLRLPGAMGAARSLTPPHSSRAGARCRCSEKPCKEAPGESRGFPDRPLARYFSNAMALLALLEAWVMLPALHAASASFTSDCALVTLEERGLWLPAAVPLPARGDCTS